MIERLTRSVQRDRQLSVELLIELSELQERGLFRDLGFPTMFDYATRRLRMSESEAALRLRAARVARAFPMALEMLSRCEIHLTTLGILARVLTPDNIQLLYEARFKTKQQVQELIVKYAPKPDVPDSIRRLPRPSLGARPSARAPQIENARLTARREPPAAPEPASTTASEQVPPIASIARAMASEQMPPVAWAARAMASGQVPPIGSTARAMVSEQMPPVLSTARAALSEQLLSIASIAHVTGSEQVPIVALTARVMASEQVPPVASKVAGATAAELLQLSPDRHKITFTASQRMRDMVEEARELRRHLDPAGRLEALFERALELLIADEKKRRFGQTAKPRPPRKAASPTPRSRYIPHEVRRQVWRRDGGQCCFCAPDGMRCGTRSRLEFHHKIPYERGGPTSTDNLELMCSALLCA